MSRSLPWKTLDVRVLVAGILAATGLANLGASEVGYYRFETSPGFNVSSAAGAPNLGGAATAYTLPGTGAGSTFSDPIPQTGATNLRGAAFNGTVDLRFTGTTAIAPSTAITIEAYISLSDTGSRYIAARRADTGNTRAWGFGVVSGNLSFLVSSDGTNAAGSFFNLNSTLSIAQNTDYYVAVTYDSVSGNLTFYRQNLSTPETLQSQLITGQTLAGGINDASNTFLIGNVHGAASDGNRWNGIIDEVRISDTALSQANLLIVPEPASAVFVTLGLATLLLLRRRCR